MIYTHWQYFLAIESDLATAGRYVDVSPANYGTFSVEYTRILLSACSEIDVVAKQLCAKIDSSQSYSNINQYRPVITSAYPEFPTMEIIVPRHGLIIRPWKEWNGDVNPPWWKSYNNVKHQRHDHYKEANLKNSLEAVAGLFAIVLYYYWVDARIGNLFPDPILMYRPRKDMPLLKGGYSLPDFE